MDSSRFLSTRNYPKNKIIEKYVSTTEVNYLLLNYDKNFICFNDSSLAYYRSVVSSYPERELLCCSPPKSMPYCSEWINPEECRITKQIDGFMLNLFYDQRNDMWEISTKSGIGGYYSLDKKTFYDMFVEFVPLFRSNELPKDACYSFVLQTDGHNEAKSLYIVAIYRINRSLSTIQYVDPLEYPYWIGADPIFKNSMLQYSPILYSDESVQLSSLIALVKSEEDLPDNAGLTIMDLRTGDRHLVTNPVYIRRQMIQRFTGLAVISFLCFLRIGKVFQACKQFPYYKTIFHTLYTEYEYFVSRVQHFYYCYYVSKTVVVVPEKYFKHIHKIHRTIYLPRIKTRCKVNNRVVRDYFMAMEPKQIYYFIFCS